jgi:hypothetical protein
MTIDIKKINDMAALAEIARAELVSKTIAGISAIGVSNLA